MAGREPGDRPNIVLINCDDLGYGDLGCYGSTVNRTPVLDRMSSEGVRFTDFYQASPLCSPSRGAMLTGCYPPRIGFGLFDGRGVLFPGMGVGLSGEERTVAEVLRERGYATMLVGKWHCGDQPAFLPLQHGFDGYYGLPYSNDMGRQVGRTKPPPLPLIRDSEVVEEQPDQAALTERYVGRCREFIRANRDRPFLLYLAHMYVHLPIYVPESFAARSMNGRYGAGVECVDWATGAVLDELEEQGLDGNTLVVFTSDNGSRVNGEGGSNGPLRGTKAQTWEGGMRVPLIARWPGRIPAGRECHEPVSAIDFLPTFAALAGAGAAVPADRPIDGRDISPLLLGEPGARSPHEALYYYNGNSLDAVRMGRWKLFVGRGGNHTPGPRRELTELYDLGEDVGETTDVAGRHPEVVREIAALAEACRVDLGDEARGVVGRNTRPIGRVENPRPLTVYDPSHAYFAAEYDLPDAG